MDATGCEAVSSNLQRHPDVAKPGAAVERSWDEPLQVGPSAG
jgi:hypothetical protein